MVAGKGVVHTEVRIQEVVEFVDCDGLHLHPVPIEVIIHTPRAIANNSVLQVGRECQPLDRQPRSLGEEVCILLAHIVVIPAAGNLTALHTIDPLNLAPVRTRVVAPRASKSCSNLIGGVVHRGIGSEGVILHNFVTNHIGLKARIRNTEICILKQCAISLVLLIVAVTISIKSRCAHLPMVIKAVIYNQLIIDLQIVVGLIIVVVNVGSVGQQIGAVRCFILTLGVVTTTIEDHLLLRDTRICKICLCLTSKREQLHRCIPAIISSLKHIGLQIGCTALDVAIRADMGQSRIDCPVASHQSRTDVYGLLVRIIRTVGERRRASKRGRRRCRSHIYRTAKGSRAIGQQACATLNLHILHRRDKIGGIIPIGRVRVGIVERYTIESHVDTRCIRAS